MSARSILNDELSAYSARELAELANVVSVLLDAADDGSVSYCAIQARVQTTLYRAVEKRMKAEHLAGRTATIIAFPKQ